MGAWHREFGAARPMADLSKGRGRAEQVRVRRECEARERAGLSQTPGETSTRLPVQYQPIDAFAELRLAHMLDAYAGTRGTKNGHHAKVEIPFVGEVDVQLLGVAEATSRGEGLASPHP